MKTSTAPESGQQAQLVWHKLDSSKAEGGIFKLDEVYRSKVPGGWLVLVANNARGITFYPDPEHKWDGGSLTA